MNCIERCIKRTFDFTLALVSLVLFSPVMLVIAILIRREEPDGDVIYTQERVGYKGRPFKLYKFRSMYMDAEKDNAPQLYQEQDPRLTKIGAFIRAHHLDEFPQLWNVIKGDMSFVGPRPERQYFIDLLRDALQRLYRYLGEDDPSPRPRYQVPGELLPLDRHQDHLSDLPVHHLRQEILAHESE